MATSTPSGQGNKGTSKRDGFLQGLAPDRNSFFVKIGKPYSGVSFTLDPTVVTFQPADCLNELVKNKVVDIELLLKVFKKCPSIENLKFYGVKITCELVKLIAQNCPKMINLELNPHEPFGFGRENLAMWMDEVKGLLAGCLDMECLIIRELSGNDDLENFMAQNGYGFDKVDRNFFFKAPKNDNDYDMAYHNVNVRPGGGIPYYVGRSHPGRGSVEHAVYTRTQLN